MRLIDADAFIEYLGLDSENAREENIGEVVSLEDFDRQITAYDLDKVVEQLKERAICPWPFNRPFIYLDIAEEIVKSGMKE